MLFSIALQVGLLASSVLAAPALLGYALRDVVAPPITYPTSDTVWTAGQQSHVDWDTSSLPPYNNISNNKGMIVLGYEDDCDPNGGEHLDLDHPLAKDFNITLGTIPVTVPDVKPRSDYILVLMGDSGNASPKFTINVKMSVRIHSPSGTPPPIRLACSSNSSTTVATTTSSADVTTSESAATATTTPSTSNSASETLTTSDATPSTSLDQSISNSSSTKLNSTATASTTASSSMAPPTSPSRSSGSPAPSSAADKQNNSNSARSLAVGWSTAMLATLVTLLAIAA